MAFPPTFHYFILGDVFMRKYPTLFSLDDNTVSFQNGAAMEKIDIMQ